MASMATRQTDLSTAWHRFVKSGETGGVPEHLRRSWQRSRAHGIDPFRDISPGGSPPVAVTNPLSGDRELHKMVRHHFHRIADTTNLSLFNILFSDPDGIVLSIEGHDKILQISENSTVTVGSDISEASIGTTAPGVSLVEKRPVLIHAHEHYSQLFHWASCLAIPVFDHENKLSGCLNISTVAENRHKLEKAALFFYHLAGSFQFEHCIQKKFEELQLYAGYFDTTFKFADKKLVLINPDLNVININHSAATCLQTTASHLYGKNIINTLGLESLKFSAMLDKKEPALFDLEIGNQRRSFTFHPMPVYHPAGKIGSILLELVPVRKRHLPASRVKHPARYTFDDIIGNSGQMNRTIRMAKQSAQTDSTILLQGDTGTGKELFAHSIHQASRFCQGPFIPVNCSAIPNELIESELFGYEKGAYTGALQAGSPGRFELAHNGTIFLDEIHTMSLLAQMKILRTIEEKAITRVGGKKIIPLNFRVIAAASEDLLEEVSRGRFLKALYFRLNVVRIRIPDLAERKEDIPALTDYFIQQMNLKFNRNITGFNKDALDLLKSHTWPGNVRELKNTLERAFNLCDNSLINADSLCLPQTDKTFRPGDNYTGIMGTVTRQLLQDSLDRFENVKEAAGFLGIPVSTFYRKMKKYNLPKVRNRISTTENSK